MGNWHVRHENDRSKVRIYSDAELMQLVKKNRFSGMELVAPVDGDGNWVPLHSLPWFRSAVGAGADDDTELIAMRARGKRKRIFGVMFSSYIGLSFIGGLVSGLVQRNPTAGMLVGAGVAAALASGIAFAVRQSKKKEDLEVKRITEARDELIKALHELEEDLQSASAAVRAEADTASIKEAITALRSQQRVLGRVGGGPTKQQLEVQLARAQKQLAAAEGALREALAAEVRAIEHRIAESVAADKARQELALRQRAMLHQIQGLRLALGRARADQTLDQDAATRIAELSRQIRQETEIARSLAPQTQKIST